jgi:hypothetical protein
MSGIQTIIIGGFIVLCAVSPDQGHQVVDVVGWGARAAFYMVQHAVQDADQRNPAPPWLPPTGASNG